MIIIMEGPDGAGKTTACKRLSNLLSCHVRHFSYPRDEREGQNMYTMYRDLIREHLLGKIEIWDRAWYSDICYGPIMRNKRYISINDSLRLERLLQGVGAMVIYCTGNKYDMYKKAKERGEDYVTNFETYELIYNEYRNLFNYEAHLVPVKTLEIIGNALWEEQLLNHIKGQH